MSFGSSLFQLKHAEIDTAFMEDLADNAKGDSNVALGEDAAAGKGKSTKGKSTEFLSTLQERRDDMNKNTSHSAQQRKTLIGLHRHHPEEETTASEWKEHIALADAVLKMMFFRTLAHASGNWRRLLA